ncbi:MAG TPA: CocE/NonD family hydrolase [Solirubrobacteraceae bacterium]|jgi:X-Pro dipeptidyl-peptidase
MRPVLAAVLLSLLLPAVARADEVIERLRLPTVDGAEISVEVRRPAEGKVPLLLTYSPYNVLNFPDETYDSIGNRYVPRGYARAYADVIGTRNSSGCWDYGAHKEQQSGVDLVNALARQPWSNGKVAMIGGSYDGTTANMVAARGADAPGLAAIVPIAAISQWYGYAYSHGVRYAGNSQEPTDEGFDTPLGFDFGFGRTPPTDPDSIPAALDRIQPCDAADHTAHGYDDSPDYDDFWLQRDYRKDAGRVQVPALVVHGWQDFNVKQEEGVEMFRALPADHGAYFKTLFVYQGPHGNPDSDAFYPVLDAFLDRTLLGKDTGIERMPAVISQGRDHAGPLAEYRPEAAWPPATTGDVALALGRGEGGGTLGGGDAGTAAYTDSGTNGEEAAAGALDAELQWLTYRSAPMPADTRLAGAPVLDLTVTVDRDHGHLVPTLFDVDAGGTAVPITRGFLDLGYRDGLAAEKPAPVGAPFSARVTFLPQDWTVRAGHQLALVVQSSNTAWAVPDDPGLGVSVAGGSLRVPVVGAAPATGPGPGGPEAPAQGDGGTPAAATPAAPGGSPAKGAGRRLLTVRLRRLTRGASRRHPGRLRASGRARRGRFVLVRLLRRGRVVLTKRAKVRHHRYRVTFRVRRSGGYRALATLPGEKVRTKRVRLR